MYLIGYLDDGRRQAKQVPIEKDCTEDTASAWTVVVENQEIDHNFHKNHLHNMQHSFDHIVHNHHHNLQKTVHLGVEYGHYWVSDCEEI